MNNVCDQCGCNGPVTSMLKYNDDPRPAKQYCGMCYTIYIYRAMYILNQDSDDFKKYDALWKGISKNNIENNTNEK
jgi:hypothetical protein